MFSFIKNIFKKENKKENYEYNHFENDINNIKNKSILFLSIYNVYAFLLHILMGLMFIPIGVIWYNLVVYFDIRTNDYLIFFLLVSVFLAAAFTFHYVKEFFNIFFIKCIYKKIYCKDIFNIFKNAYYFRFFEKSFNSKNEIKNDDYKNIIKGINIYYDNKNLKFISNLKEDDKIKVILKLKYLDYNFNKNIDILNYLENKIKIAFKNEDFMKVLKSIKKEDLYLKVKSEVIECFKLNQEEYFLLLEDLFENLEEYEKDKLYYINSIIKGKNIEIVDYSF